MSHLSTSVWGQRIARACSHTGSATWLRIVQGESPVTIKTHSTWYFIPANARKTIHGMLSLPTADRVDQTLTQDLLVTVIIIVIIHVPTAHPSS